MENAHGAGAAVVKDKPAHGDPLESHVTDASSARTATPTESTADEPAAQPFVPDRPGVNDASAPTDEAIARRAYELYCARGYVDGYDQDDWLQAEREIRASSRDERPGGSSSHFGSPESPID